MAVRLVLIFCTVWWCVLPVFSQKKTDLPGELIVSLRAGFSPENLIEKVALRSGNALIFNRFQKVSNFQNAWLFQFDTAAWTTEGAAAWLRQVPEVQQVQRNFQVELRQILPDDPLFAKQWHLLNGGYSMADADLSAEGAWDISTGGVTPAGDTIVLCVIDYGFDNEHEDFENNFWKNNAETPGDGLDNDGNGFTDDLRGWNFLSQNDDLTAWNNDHGTAVAGVIGAKGNNGRGVAGINWHAKIMRLVCPGTVAGVLAAYDYALKMRRLYNQTNGAKGAFVVATNASWGIDYGQPNEAPLWCAAYDSLGAEGILSIAATANAPTDVDVHGDLPTTCPSPYLLTVTSLDAQNRLSAQAAWGEKSIDLAGYGEGIFTTGAANSYGSRTGTSFAAPQACGAVGLIYAAPCPSLVTIAKIAPAAAPLFVKDFLLKTAAATAGLQGKTTSGGRLDLKNLLENYEASCAACPAPFDLHTEAVGDTAVRFFWSEVPLYQSVTLRYRPLDGGPGWTILYNAKPGVEVSGLSSCRAYQFSLKAQCSVEPSGWSQWVVFKTEGCCDAPQKIWVEKDASQQERLAWTPVAAAQFYTLRYRPKVLGGFWNVVTTTDPFFSLVTAEPCTDFVASVRTDCDSSHTDFTSDFVFKTSGCAACVDKNYCPSIAQFALNEWIARVKIGSWEHASGLGPGYENFTLDDLPDTLYLTPNATLPVTLTPGFLGTAFREYFRIFVDFNLDGDFDDPGELACDPGWAHDAAISSKLTTPDFQISGIARMRVSMKSFDNLSMPPVACEAFEFGQVEDYCVVLQQDKMTGVADEAGDFLKIKTFPSPACDFFDVVTEAQNATECEWILTDARGSFLKKNKISATAELFRFRVGTEALPSGLYFLKMKIGGAQAVVKVAVVR